ncbi:hypothetical protein LguiA_005153 [Lonicera macranthoides]
MYIKRRPLQSNHRSTPHRPPSSSTSWLLLSLASHNSTSSNIHSSISLAHTTTIGNQTLGI